MAIAPNFWPADTRMSATSLVFRARFTRAERPAQQDLGNRLLHLGSGWQAARLIQDSRYGLQRYMKKQMPAGTRLRPTLTGGLAGLQATLACAPRASHDHASKGWHTHDPSSCLFCLCARQHAEATAVLQPPHPHAADAVSYDPMPPAAQTCLPPRQHAWAPQLSCKKKSSLPCQPFSY